MLRKSILLSLCTSVLFIVLNHTNVYTNSSKPPLSRTGAPGEASTCGASGCHGAAANEGAGSLSISFADEFDQYVPGRSYAMTVKVSDISASRAGFQIVALDEQDLNAGTMSAEEDEFTDISVSSSKERTYAHHKDVPQVGGPTEFSFTWTAPDENVGPVTFYAAGLAANGNANKNGDLLYTLTRTVDAWSTNVSEALINELELRLFPNPVQEQLVLEYTLSAVSTVSIVLYDLSGKEVKVLSEMEEQQGQQKKQVVLDRSILHNGLYFVNIKTDKIQFAEKILLD